MIRILIVKQHRALSSACSQIDATAHQRFKSERFTPYMSWTESLRSGIKQAEEEAGLKAMGYQVRDVADDVMADIHEKCSAAAEFKETLDYLSEHNVRAE